MAGRFSCNRLFLPSCLGTVSGWNQTQKENYLRQQTVLEWMNENYESVREQQKKQKSHLVASGKYHPLSLVLPSRPGLL